MILRKISYVAAFGVALMGSAASATTLDFYGYATNEQGVSNGTTIDFDGVDVTFSASASTDNDANAYAYFDNGAGLGVCKDINGSKQCDPSNDDNITYGESVTLTFGTEYDVSDIVFRAEGHGFLTTSQTLLYSIDGGAYIQSSFNALDDLSFAGVTSISFKYDDKGTNAEQFYISSMVVTAPVPVPAAGLLLLGGLGGLAALKRRRKAA